MSDQDLSGGAAGDAKAKTITMISNIIRATGAVFMLIAAVIGLNLGGVADILGVASIAKIFGGVLFALGCIEFLVMPQVLSRILRGVKDPT